MVLLLVMHPDQEKELKLLIHKNSIKCFHILARLKNASEKLTTFSTKIQSYDIDDNDILIAELENIPVDAIDLAGSTKIFKDAAFAYNKGFTFGKTNVIPCTRCKLNQSSLNQTIHDPSHAIYINPSDLSIFKSSFS